MPLRDCCSDHAAMCGGGAGVFFMPMLTFVLCVRNDRLSMVAALYVDRHGEEDPGMKRGRYGYWWGGGRMVFCEEEEDGLLVMMGEVGSWWWCVGGVLV